MLDVAANEQGFNRIELQHRNSTSNIIKEHYKGTL